MAIQLTLKPAREQAFARDVLLFASHKYKSPKTEHWTVLVQHVQTTTSWSALWNVSKYTGQNPFTWDTCDAWSITWDKPTTSGFIHITSTRLRKKLAVRMEMVDFDPALALRAVRYDMLITVNDTLATYNGNRIGMADYILYLITQQCMYCIQDWTNQQLVLANVDPQEDREVMATLDEFIRAAGWQEFKRRYF